MAERFKDNITQSTRCASCRTPYTDPKVLSCSHIYCKACVDKLIEDRDSNLSIRCIVCQGETLISDIQDAGKLPSALAFKNVRYQKCKKHPEDEECFCLNCRIFVCHKCVVEDHIGESHRIIGSADHESNHIESIKVLRSEVDCKSSRFQKYVDYIDEEKRRVRNANKQCEGKISEAYDDLAKQLADRKKDLIKEARDRTEGVQKELEAMKKSALQYVSQLKTDADMVTNRSDVPFDIDSLAVHETLCEALQETLDREDPDYEQSRKSSKNGKSINFMRGIKELDKLVIGNVGNSGGFWCGLPTKDSMNAMARAPDGMMAVGCSIGGMQIFSADGDHQESVLKDVTIHGIEYLSDDRCVVLDNSNTIALYTPEYTKIYVICNTLGADEGGIGNLSVDGDDRIYVSYRNAKKIQVFSSEGTVEAEIPCRGYEPHQIRSYNDSLIVSSKSFNNRVRLIDKHGVVKHTYKTFLEELYPAVSQRNTILIAKVNPEMCMVSIGEYTNELKRIRYLVENFKIEKPERQWYCLQQYRSGELAFCTPDKLYIFY
nr:uncharacterized protein LOC129283587 [Lytechinus pictus]